MSRKLLLLLLLVPAPLSGEGRKLRPWDYKHYHEHKTWQEARDFCVEHHLDLLIIRSKEHNDRVRHGEGWIGLTRENSQSDWRWTTGRKANYTNWKNSGSEGGKDCAFKKKDDTQWEKFECIKSEKFLCMDETVVLVQEEKNWEEALQHCRSLVSPHGTGTGTLIHNYDLVSLLTADDHNYARKIAQAATTDEVWTGLRFLAGQWLWVDGEKMQYPKTDKCPSDIFCGTLGKRSTDQFHQRMCKEKRNFLCYRKPKP